MNNIIAASLMAAAVLVAGSTLASAQNHFRGNACIQTASPGCTPVGVSVGTCYESRLRPPNYNGQANSTKLSLFLPTFAMNFTLPTGSLVGATFKAVNALGLGQSATSYSAQARIPVLSPAAPTAATIFVNATIDINRFDSDAPTCNVRLRFQGQRFPL